MHHKGRRRSLVLPFRLTLSWVQSGSVGLGWEIDSGSDSTFRYATVDSMGADDNAWPVEIRCDGLFSGRLREILSN